MNYTYAMLVLDILKKRRMCNSRPAQLATIDHRWLKLIGVNSNAHSSEAKTR